MSRVQPKPRAPVGRTRMVDVGDKKPTRRLARARGRVHLSQTALRHVRAGTLVKGDVLEVARIAGIQAAKKTPDLLPLCHLLLLDHVDVELRPDPKRGSIEIESSVSCRGSTGVEMEAVVAVCVAAATVYDMCKSLDRTMRIDGIELVEKSGGRSGRYRKESA